MSYSAYSRAQGSAENPRRTEYRLLGQVTAALIAAKESGDKRKIFDALLWNQQVWDAFFLDVTHEQNQLPVPLKRNLVTLCMTVRRMTDSLIDKGGDLDELIVVNRHIMDGLKEPSPTQTVNASVAPARVNARG
jgi:flagellar protein FlaF